MTTSSDDDVFAGLEDAYGPATLISGLLRDAAGERPGALDALGELAGSVFHQGSFYSATAPAAGALVAQVQRGVPARGAIVRLLADMASGGEPRPLGWNPYHFYASPAPPTYPEALATLAVIHAARPCLEAALTDAEPEVRAAGAYALAALGGTASLTCLARAQVSERETAIRCAMTYALAVLGRAVEPAREPEGLAREVALAVSVLHADEAPRGALEPLARLALRARLDTEAMPFAYGDVASIAVLALERLGPRDHDGVVAALWRVLDARLARGERIDPGDAPRSARVDDPLVSTDAPRAAIDDAPLRSIAAALARLEVPVAPDGAYLRRASLGDGARRVLALTVEHAIPLPVRGAPWIAPEAMRRFLAGGGALDRVLVLEGREAPVFEHLHRLARPGDPARSATLDALVGALSTDALFDTVLDALTGAYPPPSGSDLAWIAVTELVPRARDRLLADCRPRFDSYASSLLAQPWVSREAASFALLPALTDGTAVDPRCDRLASAALALEPASRAAWLAAFPEPRRSRLVAALGNAWLRATLAPWCDAETLRDALVDAFVAPSCTWLAHEAARILLTVDPPRLRAAVAHTADRKRSLLEAALAELSGEGFFVLELTAQGDGVRACLARRSGEPVATRVLTDALMPEEFDWIAAALSATARPVVELAGELDSTRRYQVMMRLGERLHCEIRGGSMRGTSAHKATAR